MIDQMTGPELELAIANETILLAWFDGTDETGSGPESPAFAATMIRFARHLGDRMRVVLVDTDNWDSLARKYGAYGAPELVFFKDGQKRDHHIGVTALVELLRWISPYVTDSEPGDACALSAWIKHSLIRTAISILTNRNSLR